MAWLDRLGPAKEVAQIGAAIGREFSHPLLAAVTHKPEAELGSALDRLIEAGLLSRQGLPPDATYLFKHALVQDAAYGTLLRETGACPSGGGVGISPRRLKRWHGQPGAHAAARSCFSVSAADTFTSVHRFKGSIPQ